MTHTDDMGLQSQAMKVASVILASSGVKIQWHDPSQCPGEAIIITLSNNEPASLRPGLLAYALPFEGTHVVETLAELEQALERRKRELGRDG